MLYVFSLQMFLKNMVKLTKGLVVTIVYALLLFKSGEVAEWFNASDC